MHGAWNALQRCWNIADADDGTRLALLDRQLRSHFRITPSCIVASLVTAFALLLSFWSRADKPQALLWFGFFVATHVAWMVHARTSLQASTASSLATRKRELHKSALLASLGALAWCIEAVLAFHVWEIRDMGLVILVATCFPAMMTTGVLVGFCTPLVASAWLGVMTAGGCLLLWIVGFDYHFTTMCLLAFYATVLMGAVLYTSRMFVARIRAELEAEHGRQVVGLLLGDFEENANDWLWECDNAGVLTRASPRLAQVFGLDPSRMVGTPLASLFSAQRVITVPSDNAVGVAFLQDCLAGTAAFRNVIVEARLGGCERSWKLSAKPLLQRNGEKTGWRGVGSEVSDARVREMEGIRRERHLRHLASHDSLTQLPNRRAFLEAIEAMGDGDPPPVRVDCSAMAFIDLDNFKAINDALGHSVGDAVLGIVAERLRGALAPGDFLARLGGDEFAILMRGLPGGDPLPHVHARLGRVLDRLRTPETVERFRVDVRASIGVTPPSSAPENAHELMRKADIALYAAKGSGRDTFVVYEEGMGSQLEHRLSMVSDMAAALEHDEFEVVYQPIVDLEDFRIVGCEALLRWRHPRYGPIQPSEFVPTAEESGLIVPMGLWVLERSCRDAAHWPRGMFVAVNMSAVQIDSPGIVESVVESVRRGGLSPERVELEITESAIARHDVAARGVLQRLRAHGFRLAIDDFGTGYSSMAQLRELPFDKLKLDRSFVAGINGERSVASRAIIASLLHLSRSMELSVTAEGVENELECRVLWELGCRYGQGYLFSRPQPQERLLQAL